MFAPDAQPIEVSPVVVLSQVFPARPSSIPDIRQFVRRCLAESPLTEEGTREVGETVFRALLDAAGPTGSINVAFRIFPEHVEVDVLHSDVPLTMPVPPYSGAAAETGAREPAPLAAAALRRETVGRGARDGRDDAVAHPVTFAEWMQSALHQQGLTQQDAARQLGVSVKTISRWVGGATEPRMRELMRIQELFGDLKLARSDYSSPA